MKEGLSPKHNKDAYKAFMKWKNSLSYDLGDHIEDWEDWWICFLAGWLLGQKELAIKATKIIEES